jgi:putative Mg2+ transporter-C (MgtC) family protein
MFPHLPFDTGVLRLVVALALGAAVGFERERGERAAGICTHALVCVGAALIMMVSAYGFSDLPASGNVVLDPSRIAAQVVSGIGFLGAGVILLREEVVRGLTTAAGLWFVAGVGLACGGGLLQFAVLATVLALVILVVLRVVERWLFPQRRAHRLRLRVQREAVANQALGAIYAACTDSGVHVDELRVREKGGHSVIDLLCRARDRIQLAKAVTVLSALPGVIDVHAYMRARDTHDRSLLSLLRRRAMAGNRQANHNDD